MKTRECIKWLWRASDGVRRHILLNSLIGILHVASSLTFVWICKALVDIATTGTDGNLSVYICILIGCQLLQVALTALEQRISSHSDILLKNKLRHLLFTRLMESRWNGKENFHTGDTLNRVMEDVRVVAESITTSIPAILTAGVQFIAAFLFLFSLQPGLAWAIPGIMIAALLISKSYISRMRRLTKDIRSSEGNMQALMQESLQHRLVIHTLERTPHISDTLTQQQENLRGQVLNKTGYTIFARGLIQIGFAAGYTAAFLWGVFGIRSGAATFGMMTAFLQLVGQLQRPIMNLSRQVPPLINSITSAERLSEIESIPLEETGEPQNLGMSIGLRFNDVHYSYPDSARSIIEGFSHDFKPGSTTALVGETGIGKSTLMRLMLSLLSPDKGGMELYNGSQRVSVSPQTRCNIIYVPQGNTLMSGTIRENLLLGDPSADDEQLKEALFLAAADFVMELPEGLDTMCGERGAGLSEGQAQRIAIARSLLRKGGLLLLDEPTSALDAETEETLLKRLITRLDGRTMILVTHREVTAALCSDQVRLS
ncbi:MAG: ABC transporter ATP-binding protein [Bacteroidales bacterium]|nr:ABC transporter ATP-binding protein [Bacteroidales bacterium]